MSSSLGSGSKADWLLEGSTNNVAALNGANNNWQG